MKKILIILLVFLTAASEAALAVPAWPGRFTYTEPDGTVRQLERHGDEYFHWTTDAETGQVVELDLVGYWRPARLSAFEMQQAAALRRQANQYRMAAASGSQDFNTGIRHIPVLLVEFTDVHFTVPDPRTRFQNLLNQPGYSDYQATGSVLDYFQENSHRRFTPVFDVFGPVELPHEMAYYGGGKGTNEKAVQAVVDGAKLLDSQIDFSNYDSDSDGVVDMLLMYFAGYSEAEGGPENAIWPHQYYVNVYKNVQLDGKLLSRYFCTAELRGNKGNTLCSIGATCHEFSHALGLPDFYDTDNEENGQSSGLYFFSLMSHGCYNDNARTPPFLNAEERVMLGWMDADEIKELPDGVISFTSVSENVAYKSLTDTEGEYYLYECRDGYSWDTPLPAGMLAYHVDRSSAHSLGGISCYYLWENWEHYNNLNCYGNHPCFYVVPAAAQKNYQYDGAMDRWVFPGSARVSAFHPEDWDGKDSGVSLLNIRFDESEAAVSLTVENHFERLLKGTVLTGDETPVQGVYISLTAPGTDRRIRRKGSRAPAESAETTTGPDGSFVLDVKSFGEEVHLTAIKPGYKAFEGDIPLGPRTTSFDIFLRANGDTGQSVLQLYDENAKIWSLGLGLFSEMAASRFSTSDLMKFTGCQITSFQYYVNANYKAKGLYFIVDDAASGERLVTYPIKDFAVAEMAWADVSEAGFRIPGGRDLFIGYAIVESDFDYPFVVLEGKGNYYGAELDLARSDWQDLSYYGTDLLISITLEDTGGTPVTDKDSLAQMGFNCIDPGTGVYRAGESFRLQLIEAPSNSPVAVTWLWDGRETEEEAVTLTSGEHTVEARLYYAEGSMEVLELPLKVN